MDIRHEVTKNIVIGELKQHLSKIILMMLLVLVGTGMGLISPLLIKAMFDSAVPNRDYTLLLNLLVGIVVTSTLAMGLQALQNYFRARIGEDISQRLRKSLFAHIIRVRLLDIERITSGSIIHTITRACGQIGEVYIADKLLPVIVNSITLIGIILVMIFINWQLLLIVVIAFPISHMFVSYIKKHADELNRRLYHILESGSSYLQEVILAMRTIRGTNAMAAEDNKWEKWIEDHREIKAKSITFHTMALSLPLNLINYIVLGLVYGYGAMQIMGNSLTIGGLIAFVTYIPRAYQAFLDILAARIGASEAEAAAEQIDALFGLEQESSIGAELVLQHSNKNLIEFDHVSFDYGRGDFTLNNLSFEIRSGEFIGIVGASGGGKSTIIDLLMGFYTPKAGTIRINGTDSRELSLASLRSQIAYVPQDVFVWNTSILNNLSYPHTTYSEETITTSSRAVQLHDFVSMLPEGYATVIGERGLTLSGGEKQRLAFGRAILRNTPILLLDEATSALDAITEMKIRDVVEDIRHEKTIIVVAHRLATIMNADRIFVLENGQIVESGPPAQILKKGGTFAKLYEAQRL